jgi:hypothetical protein
MFQYSFSSDKQKSLNIVVYQGFLCLNLLPRLGMNYFHITLIINLIQKTILYRSRKILLFAYICYYKVNYSFNWQQPSKLWIARSSHAGITADIQRIRVIYTPFFFTYLRIICTQLILIPYSEIQRLRQINFVCLRNRFIFHRVFRIKPTTMKTAKDKKPNLEEFIIRDGIIIRRLKRLEKQFRIQPIKQNDELFTEMFILPRFRQN